MSIRVQKCKEYKKEKKREKDRVRRVYMYKSSMQEEVTNSGKNDENQKILAKSM